MRELNRYFPDWRMRFDDLRMFRHTMRPNYFCWSLDQHAAYMNILAHPRLAKYFGFELDGSYYSWSVLPFGWKLSPFFYCKLVRQMIKMWRRAGISIQAFVDDQFGGADSFFDAVVERNRVLRDNIFYGFSMSAKSAPLPFQRLLALGYGWTPTIILSVL